MRLLNEMLIVWYLNELFSNSSEVMQMTNEKTMSRLFLLSVNMIESFAGALLIHPTAIFTLSFIFTSFNYASVCE